MWDFSLNSRVVKTLILTGEMKTFKISAINSLHPFGASAKGHNYINNMKLFLLTQWLDVMNTEGGKKKVENRKKQKSKNNVASTSPWVSTES